MRLRPIDSFPGQPCAGAEKGCLMSFNGKAIGSGAAESANLGKSSTVVHFQKGA